MARFIAAGLPVETAERAAKARTDDYLKHDYVFNRIDRTAPLGHVRPWTAEETAAAEALFDTPDQPDTIGRV
ncbi:MAG: hypothetical protein ACYS0D_02230 [Planctomycetota bacterium]